MAAIAGPRVPLLNETDSYFDARNLKSYQTGSNVLISLLGDTTIDVSNLSLSNGYFVPTFDTTTISNQTLQPAAAYSFVFWGSPTQSSVGTMFSIESGAQQIYQTVGNATYDSVDYGANAIVSISRTIDYDTSTTNATYDSVDYGANAIVSISRTIDYNTSTIMVDYLSLASEMTSDGIQSYIDNAYAILSLSAKNGVVFLRFKNGDREMNIAANYTPDGDDLFTVCCGSSGNVYTVSLYQDSLLLGTSNLASGGDQIPGGNISIFSNGNQASYSNIPMRLFNIYERELTSDGVLELKIALNPT